MYIVYLEGVICEGYVSFLSGDKARVSKRLLRMIFIMGEASDSIVSLDCHIIQGYKL